MKDLFRKISLTFGLIVLMLPGFGATAHASGIPQLTVSPASQRIHMGDTLKVTLHIDANGTSLNTLNVVASYPADKLSFMGLDKTGAYFDAFVPATPVGQNGKIQFAASALQHGSTTDSVVVGSLLFKATTDSGNATVSFDGTQAANGGDAIDVDTSSVYVGFDSGASTTSSSILISAIKVSDIATTGASVSWHTDSATTGTVDYGTNAKYGFSVSSDTAGTDHTVKLGKLFAGQTTVHFHITAVDANGETKSTSDQTFTTLGYPVRITVVNAKQQPVKGANVQVAGHPTIKTSADGSVTVTNVGPGNQKVVAGSGKAQFIAVKALLGIAAEKPQDFTLKATSNTAIVVVSGLLFLALIAVGTYALLRFHGKTKSKP